jgi:hypothetical protein
MKTTTKKRKATRTAKNPFASVAGSWYISAELGHGQFVEEVAPGLWRCTCYTDPTKPSYLTQFLSVDQLTEVTFCASKEVWLDMLNDECDCSGEDEDEGEQCMCPDCTELAAAVERRVERLEEAETDAAVRDVFLATAKDTTVSEQTVAQCKAELKAFDDRNKQ